MNIFKEFLAVFYVPGHKKRAIVELEEARCALLSAQSNYDYAVTNLAYNQHRVNRLTRIVQDLDALESHNGDTHHPLCSRFEVTENDPVNIGAQGHHGTHSPIPLHERRTTVSARQSR